MYKDNKKILISDEASGHITVADLDWRHQLTQIKGVGRWTVEMILMFTLKRPDVLPLDDLFVKTAMIELYRVTDLRGKALNQKLLSPSPGSPTAPQRVVIYGSGGIL